jgi:hypothetical protein
MNRCDSCGEPFVAARPYHRRCWDCWHRAPRPTGGDDLGRLIGLIREAVLLTHPDRHPPERGEQATRTTARLLGLLGELRARETAA